MGRGAEGLRRPEARAVGDGGRADRVLPRAPGALQMSEICGVRPAAAHGHGEDPQERAARAPRGGLEESRRSGIYGRGGSTAYGRRAGATFINSCAAMAPISCLPFGPRCV